jgi:hypothetical protein
MGLGNRSKRSAISRWPYVHTACNARSGCYGRSWPKSARPQRNRPRMRGRTHCRSRGSSGRGGKEVIISPLTIAALKPTTWPGGLPATALTYGSIRRDPVIHQEGYLARVRRGRSSAETGHPGEEARWPRRGWVHKHGHDSPYIGGEFRRLTRIHPQAVACHWP